MNVFESRYAQLGHPVKPISLLPSIRVNTLRTTEALLVARLEKKGVQLEKIPFAPGYWVKHTPFSLGASIEYLLGHIMPQEAAAQLPVTVLDPKPGEKVLDMAAAPGGKTTQIAALMHNKGILVAVDKNNLRIPSLKNNLERMGVTNSIVFNTAVSKLIEWKMMFDKVLLDAPCMGNYAQKDWFNMHSVKELDRNMLTQKQLLSAAVQLVKRNGTIVYSTCSVEPEEDEMLIDWALRTLPVRCVDTGLQIGVPGLTKVFGKGLSADVMHTRRIWPGKTEGFFVAKLVKK